MRAASLRIALVAVAIIPFAMASGGTEDPVEDQVLRGPFVDVPAWVLGCEDPAIDIIFVRHVRDDTIRLSVELVDAEARASCAGVIASEAEPRVHAQLANWSADTALDLWAYRREGSTWEGTADLSLLTGSYGAVGSFAVEGSALQWTIPQSDDAWDIRALTLEGVVEATRGFGPQPCITPGPGWPPICPNYQNIYDVTSPIVLLPSE